MPYPKYAVTLEVINNYLKQFSLLNNSLLSGNFEFEWLSDSQLEGFDVHLTV